MNIKFKCEMNDKNCVSYDFENVNAEKASIVILTTIVCILHSIYHTIKTKETIK